MSGSVPGPDAARSGSSRSGSEEPDVRSGPEEPDARASEGAPPELADLHAHYVPGVDDGAPTVEDALRYLRRGFEGGVVRVAATPHLPSSYAESAYRREAERSFRHLREAVEEELPGLELRLAWEVRLGGTPIDTADEGLWLGPGGHVLVEFDRLSLPPEPLAPLRPLLEAGLTPVLAHPERYVGAEETEGWAEALREAGVRLCLNAGSLVGSHGRTASEVARRLLARGQADLVASDHHARPARSDGLPDVRATLAALGRDDAAHTLLWRNPSAALDGGEMEPPPAVEWPEPTSRSRRLDPVGGGTG